MSEAFGAFLENFHKDFSEGKVAFTWWNTIANRVYIPSAAQEGSIRSPICRLIHRLIASTINMRKDDDKFPTLDIFYLWCIIMPNTFCNIPYCLAKYLGEGVLKNHTTSKINGGMFITCLARTYGVLERGAGNFLTMVPTPSFSIMLYQGHE